MIITVCVYGHTKYIIYFKSPIFYMPGMNLIKVGFAGLVMINRGAPTLGNPRGFTHEEGTRQKLKTSGYLVWPPVFFRFPRRLSSHLYTVIVGTNGSTRGLWLKNHRQCHRHAVGYPDRVLPSSPLLTSYSTHDVSEFHLALAGKQPGASAYCDYNIRCVRSRILQTLPSHRHVIG